MYSLVRSSHPATGVEHSLSCNFFHTGEKNLVVAGANVLRVFRLVPDLDSRGKEEDQSRLKMECVASWELFGWIQSMASVRLTGGERDSLLLTFKDAKLSLVEYNPDNHDLQTLSLHHFEDEEVRGGIIHNEWVPSVRVDPDNRCAAMLAYGRKIVILPFKRDMTSGMEGEDSTADLSLDGLALSNSSRVMPSYTLDLATVIQTHTVDNIIDIQFLHGYNQPTLLILYEPLKTYAGRIAVRKDTCRLDVVTLDVKEKLAAFIWSREVLPFDCVRAVPVPQPVGGTLVFAVNSLFYLNQGIPIYGVSLNSTGDKGVTTDILIKQLEGVKLSLDCAVADFLSPDQLVISLKGGELYVLSLLVDSMRSVKGFHLDKAAASVLTTCVSLAGPGYLFLGSRLGNSLLLKFTSREAGQVGQARRQEREPPNKKKRLDMQGDWLDTELEMDTEFEMYGSQETAAHKINAFTFEVCDSLLNIGPCGQVAMGEPAFLSEEFTSSAPDPDIELVTTAGHAKNGALCLLQKTVRPQVVTTFELPGCQDMWTVYSGQGKQEHAFLILSRNESSMILQTGQEINELDSSGFYTTGPTVFSGNLGSNQFIVQVTHDSVLLLKDSDLVQTVPLDLDSRITFACISDPHLAVLASSGQAAVLTLTGGQLSVVKTRIGELPGRAKSPFLAISLYRDVSGLLTSENRLVGNRDRRTGRQASTANVQDLDEEDELLYGSSDAAGSVFGGAGVADQGCEEEEPWRRHLEQVTATYWLVGVRESGNFELYSVPDFSLRFVSLNFPHQLDVLVDNMSTRATSHAEPTRGLDRLSPLTEILLVGLGMQGHRPVLLGRTKNSELVMYEVYPYYSRSLAPEQLKIRFKKINHGLILRERRSKTKKDVAPPTPILRSSLRYFSDIAGYEGVFLPGPYPHWLFFTARGELRTHPMPIDGSVTTFAPFHNVNCPQGFLYFNRKSELRICVLPAHLSYDAPWPVRKVPLRCTPHYITFHIESKTFAVITSVAEQTNKIWKFNGDDKELSIEDRSDRFIYPTMDKFSLQLFSPNTWEPIPGTKVQLDDWEYVTCMKHLYLSSEGMHSGQRGFIVVGTNFSYGEDITSRGHVKIYDIIEVVPEPGQPLTKNKIKTMYDKEQKGPVTAISAVSGFLVSTVGQKIYIWQFKDKDLHGIAFIDSQVYVHQIHSLKNFLLVGDVYKSINVLQYQQDYRTVSLISRDTNPMEVYACEFTIDNGHLGFVASDSMRNLCVFMYSPESREAMGGHRLMRKADIHVGQHINCMWRVRAKLSDPSTSQRLLAANEKRHVTWYATLDGSIGHLLPVAEKTYRRLLMLMNVMTNNLPHTAGLNPKGFRTIRQNRKDMRNPSRGIVDGDLVFKFTDLTAALKAEFARKIGTSADEIMDDLAELDRNAAHF
eukprot:GFUD01021700.1.p1 GENE.GFUD01021700.1~~GFUD01021700.1.p1  ORF type:complete len:1406 (+),score=514.90 GFUD01021700.1:53-4270(+)